MDEMEGESYDRRQGGDGVCANRSNGMIVV